MSKEPSLFTSWLQAQHLLGKFNRKDEFGQVSLTPLDELVLLRMEMIDGDYEAETAKARFEEAALLHASFSGLPQAKDIFTSMFPQFASEDEDGLEFIIPESKEDMHRMLEDARSLFAD